MTRLHRAKQRLTLASLKRRSSRFVPGMIHKCGPYRVQINDGPNFFMLYKDVFVNRVYHFDSGREDPYILDCGSNIGMSVLYFKMMYPKARILAFEPDPSIFPYLEKNMALNGIGCGVELCQSAIAASVGTLEFWSDGRYGSCLASKRPLDIPDSWRQYKVPCIRLADLLSRPVDMLKINVEGVEWEILADSADKLPNVKRMIVEYHHLPGLERNLHKILQLLHDKGFEYLIYDFDHDSNPQVSPPFSLEKSTRYFLLIYASRVD